MLVSYGAIVGAENIEVQVRALNKVLEQEWQFDAQPIQPRNFDSDDHQVNDLAVCIASALASEDDFLCWILHATHKWAGLRTFTPVKSSYWIKEKGNKSKSIV